MKKNKAKVLLLCFFLILAIFTVFSANNLFIQNKLRLIGYKVSLHFFGQEEIYLSQITDVPRYVQGFVGGWLNPLDIPEVDIKIKQKALLRLLGESNGSRNNVRAVLVAKDHGDGSRSEKLIKLRLKGDRAIHTHRFSTSSFRVDMKDEKFQGLDKFALQRPVIRGYTWEPLISDVFKSQGLLALKHKYIFLSVNGERRGLYHVEEVPGPRTVEKQKRKNGPIFSVDDAISPSIGGLLDTYSKKAWEGTALHKTAKASLYEQFRLASEGHDFRADLFDFKEWAKFFALIDLFGSYHAADPKSVRYYFNPTVGKFQPLLFDAHFNGGFENFFLGDLLLRGDFSGCLYICDNKDFFLGFLRSQEFLDEYVAALRKYVSNKFLNSQVYPFVDNYAELNNYLYSRLSRSDLIFSEGFGLFFFDTRHIAHRASMLKSKIESLTARMLSAPKSKVAVLANDGFQPSMKEVAILDLSDVNFVGTSLSFSKPTVLILRGSNVFSGPSPNSPLQISGSVMMIQSGGSLDVTNVVFNGPRSFEFVNRRLDGSLNLIDAKFRGENLSIVNPMSEDAVNFVNSVFTVSSIVVRGSKSDAIDSDFSVGTISDLSCFNIGNDCIDLSESEVVVDNLRGDGIRDKAISAGENSSLKISRVDLSKTEIGLVSKDGSTVSVDELSLVGVRVAASVFNKKPEYKSGSLVISAASSDSNFLVLKDYGAEVAVPWPDEGILGSSKEIEGLLYGNTYGVKTLR